MARTSRASLGIIISGLVAVLTLWHMIPVPVPEPCICPKPHFQCPSCKQVEPEKCPSCPDCDSLAKNVDRNVEKQEVPVDDSEPFEVEEAYRKDCERFLSDAKAVYEKPIYSQFRQDWFIFHNYFKNKRRGFYVDVGANHAKVLSNSLFFDKCLGWKGICVEPNPQYASGYKSRSCKLVQSCVYKEHKSLWFDMPNGINKGTAGRILNCTDDGVCSDKGIGVKVQIQCQTLDEILSVEGLKSQDGTPAPVIDMMSLDVEGFEIDAVESFQFELYNISLVTIEVNKVPQNKLHYVMSQGGFYKDISVGIDDIFVRRPHQHTFPPDWNVVGPYSQRYHK